MRILLDCDGILGDFASEVVNFCNKYGDSQATVDDVYSFDILEALGCADLQDRLDIHMADTDFCRHMPVYLGAREFVDKLRSMDHEIVVVTSPYKAVPTWEHARREWLWRNFSVRGDDVIFCKRKELVSPEAPLVDDKIGNLTSRPERGILLDRPWNRDCRGLFRAMDYGDIVSRIRWLDPEVRAK
jgi:5'(3')-deoxyribonucleotidase